MGSCLSINNEEVVSEEKKKRKGRICRKDEGSLSRSEKEHVMKIYSSDEGLGRYVAEPDVDEKANDFIRRFHNSRVMDEEGQQLQAVY